MMNYFGDKGLDLFGYLQRTIIQDFSINGQANGVEKLYFECARYGWKLAHI